MKTSLIVSALLVQMNLLPTATAAEHPVQVVPPPPPAVQHSVRIFNLKNASPEKVSSMLYEVYKDAGWRFVPDERTKSLFIAGPGDPPAEMIESIKQADSPSPEGSVRVFSLKYANPDDLCRVLQNLPHDSQFRCSADNANRRMIIRATEGEWVSLEKLIEQTDVTRGHAEAPPVQVIPLKHQFSDDLLKEMVKVVGVNDVKIAFDRERNAVIASGASDAIERLKAVLQRLDQTLGATTHPEVEQHEATKTVPFRIRLAWLTSSGGEEVPLDLRPVVEELTKIGTNVPFLVTQTVVQTNTGNAVVVARPTNTELRLECRRGKTKDMFNITLQASSFSRPKASDPKGPPLPPMPFQPEIVNVQTELQVPFDHPIVLAVTPTQEKETSAFVLEFLAAK